MKPRIEAFSVEPKLMQSLLKLEETVTASGLEKSLIELVKIRASQINACAYCLHMHTVEALAQGERIERLLLLDAWRESPPGIQEMLRQRPLTGAPASMSIPSVGA